MNILENIYWNIFFDCPRILYVCVVVVLSGVCVCVFISRRPISTKTSNDQERERGKNLTRRRFFSPDDTELLKLLRKKNWIYPMWLNELDTSLSIVFSFSSCRLKFHSILEWFWYILIDWLVNWLIIQPKIIWIWPFGHFVWPLNSVGLFVPVFFYKFSILHFLLWIYFEVIFFFVKNNSEVGLFEILFSFSISKFKKKQAIIINDFFLLNTMIFFRSGTKLF